MITYYEKNETDFTHNGLGVLDRHISSAVVTEELNGIFKLEFDYPLRAPHAGGLISERLVRCSVPGMDDQLFRINERESALGGMLHIVAFHVFYDLAQNLIEDTNVVAKKGARALTQILGATQFSHPFTASSDIEAVATARLVRLSVAEILLDGDLDNGYLARWGGEIIRDNFHIAIDKVRGSDNGVEIRDRKNLTGYRSNVDFSSATTRIMPLGYGGLMLPEKYVDSPRIADYATPRIRIIKYDKVRATDGSEQNPPEGALPLEEAYAALRSLAAFEFSDNHIDMPSAIYEVKFVSLEKTEEYKDIATLEKVNIGDTVSVVHSEDGLEVSARVIAYTFNPLTTSYISLELGSITPKFTNSVSAVKSAVVASVIDAVESGSVALPQTVDSHQVNYYGAVEPLSPRSGDLWYKENGDKLELWIYETREGVTQWYPLISDITNEELRLALDGAKAESAEALSQANLAFDNALAASVNASLARNVASDAYDKSVKSTTVTYATSTSGTTAPTTGWQAAPPDVSSDHFLWTRTVFTLRDNTTTTAYGISKTGDKGEPGDAGASAPAITSVREQYYLSTSDITLTGGSWSENVPTWSSGTYYWTRVVASYADGTQTLSDAVLDSALNNSLITALRANTLAETLETEVSQHATAIALAASNVTSLTTRLSTAESTLTVQADQIAAKAEQTTVDTLTGRVTTAENTIIQNAESISVFLSKTTKAVNGLVGANILQTAWERGTLSNATGAEGTSTTHARSGFIDVVAGKKYLLQTYEGTQSYPVNGTAYLLYYRADKTFISYTTNSSTTTPFSAMADAAYMRIRFTSVSDVSAVNCYLIQSDTAGGYSDLSSMTDMLKLQATSDALLVTVTETKEMIGTPFNFKVSVWQRGTLNTSTGAEVASTSYLRSGFVDVTPGDRYIGQMRDGTALSVYYFYYGSDETFMSYTASSSAITVPADVAKMRCRVYTTVSPDDYKGAVSIGTTRTDFSKGDNLYSALLMQSDTINLRVAKNDVVNQINVSTESILISGSKIHITGETTINSAVIQSAMIANLAVTNAKIADATIQSAKIAAIDAAKITTGTLAAARIGAATITADKVSTNFLETLTGSSAIRITGTTISYYSGSAVTSQINANGFELTRDSVKIGRIGTNSIVSNAAWRGLVFDLEYAGNYMSWAWRESTSATAYTTKFTYYRSKLENGMEKGFHFGDVVYFKSGIAVASGSSTVTNYIGYWTFSSTAYLARVTTNSKAGVALGGSNLLLGSQGTWVDLNTLRAICALLASKTVYLPASSTGLGSYWSVTFPSMTTWST